MTTATLHGFRPMCGVCRTEVDGFVHSYDVLRDEVAVSISCHGEFKRLVFNARRVLVDGPEAFVSQFAVVFGTPDYTGRDAILSRGFVEVDELWSESAGGTTA